MASVRKEIHTRARIDDASAQAIAQDDGTTKVVWLADFLPDTIAGDIDAAMSMGTRVMKKTLDLLADR
jgi:uncharacterized Rossmann fold enzyme